MAWTAKHILHIDDAIIVRTSGRHYALTLRNNIDCATVLVSQMVPTNGNIVGTWCKFIFAITTFADCGDRGTKQVLHGAIQGDFHSVSVYLEPKVLPRRYGTETRVPYEDGQIIGFI